MLRKLTLCLALLGLSGCFEAETGMRFSADGMVDGISILAVDKSFYEMAAAGDDFCDEGRLVEQETSIACVFEERLTVQEAIAKAAEKNAYAPEQHEVPTFILQEVAPGQVLVEMPIGSLMSDAQMPQEEGMPDPVAMMSMMGIDMTGRNMHFWVVAPRILQSSEAITQNGTRTEILIPIQDLLARTVPEDRVFRVLLQYN